MSSVRRGLSSHSRSAHIGTDVLLVLLAILTVVFLSQASAPQRSSIGTVSAPGPASTFLSAVLVMIMGTLFWRAIGRIRKRVASLRDLPRGSAIRLFVLIVFCYLSLNVLLKEISPAIGRSLGWTDWKTGDVFMYVRAYADVAFLGVMIALWPWKRPVRVLVLRSYAADFPPGTAKAIRAVCGGIGRVEGLRRPDSLTADADGWGLESPPKRDRWMAAVRRLTRRMRLVIVDVTKQTPGLKTELEILAEAGPLPCIYVARAKHDEPIPDSVNDLITYEYNDERSFVSALVNGVERVCSIRGPRWERHKQRVLRRPWASPTPSAELVQ